MLPGLGLFVWWGRNRREYAAQRLAPTNERQARRVFAAARTMRARAFASRPRAPDAVASFTGCSLPPVGPFSSLAKSGATPTGAATQAPVPAVAGSPPGKAPPATPAWGGALRLFCCAPSLRAIARGAPPAPPCVLAVARLHRHHHRRHPAAPAPGAFVALPTPPLGGRSAFSGLALVASPSSRPLVPLAPSSEGPTGL